MVEKSIKFNRNTSYLFEDHMEYNRVLLRAKETYLKSKLEVKGFITLGMIKDAFEIQTTYEQWVEDQKYALIEGDNLRLVMVIGDGPMTLNDLDITIRVKMRDMTSPDNHVI